MNISTRISLTLLSLLVVCASVAPASQVIAQTNSSTPGQALEIAPPVVNLTADPGQSIETKISIRDVSTAALLVRSEVNDFVANGEDGTPKLLLDETAESPYSMKSWIAPLPNMTLKPKQVQDLPVSIRVPANASPGGYFAVVRFTASAPEIDQTGVSLSASLGALILLRVNGDAKESMSVEEFFVKKNGVPGSFFESTPLDFVLRVKNTGNIHEQPTGQAIVTDMFGNNVAALNYNLEALNVLPGSIRRFESPLNKEVIGDRVLFGPYTAQLKITYGADKQTLTANLSFWVIPWKLILFGVVGLVGAFFLLRAGLRRYNERIIQQSRRRRY